MSRQVVVLGSGYAGAGAVRSLEGELEDASVVWISERDYHLVRHEVHRCIRDPSVREAISIPVGAIAPPATRFRRATVTGVDADERVVELADGDPVGYDYLLVCLGSRTAFFGIPGLRERAHTLESVEDAVGIHEAVRAAGRAATGDEPARVVVGGAGLSGIQAAGEIAALRDEGDLPVEVRIVEGLAEILPGRPPGLQRALRERLSARGVGIVTGEFVGAVDDDAVHLGADDALEWDVLVWTGGITGREAATRVDVERDERTDRFPVGADFRTDDERVFAVGDAAIVDQPGTEPAPPTAQAAWQAAAVAGRNVARAIRGQSLERFRFRDRGTVVSVGDSAVAHDVAFVPFVDTFGGLPARLLKKAIAARWIADVDGYGRALRAWPDA